jgi:hypothetical protein
VTTTFTPAVLEAFRHWQRTGDGYDDLLDALHLPPWAEIANPDERCPYPPDHFNYRIWKERRTEEALDLFNQLEAAAAE